MIRFRAFRNADTPKLAELWRATDLGPLAMQPMSTALLETAVVSKPYFDRHGLLVATDDDQLVGFAHAAFGPNAEASALDRATGSIVMLVVPPHPEEPAIAAGLIDHAHTYLRQQGARTVLAGGIPNLGGFYLGLYGGADLPGILDSSPGMQAGFLSGGFVPHDRINVMRRSVSGYRPPIDRLQIALRRTTQLTAIDPNERFNLGATGEMSMRVVDLVAPIGKGTRGLIVSPPKAGKTTLLEQIARAIRASHPHARILDAPIRRRSESRRAPDHD